MKGKSTLAPGRALVVTGLCWVTPRVRAEFLSDNFDADHKYWDGTTVDLGTIWDGAQGTEFANAIDASITNRGRLTVRHSDTANSYVPGPLFDVAALYVEVTGNFDAQVQMPVMPADTPYLTYAIAAWTSDQTKALHLDNLRAVSDRVRFRDMVAPDEYALQIENAPWFRLTRTGDVFEGFYGPDGVNGTSIGTMERDYGATLRVGPAAWNIRDVAFDAQFDNFQIVPEPSPLVLLALAGVAGAVLVALKGRRRGRVCLSPD